MTYTFNGLPLHPLLVHAVVVLVPIAAVLVVLHAAWPAARRRLGVVTPLMALVVTVLLPITTEAGEHLQRSLGTSSAAIDTHAQLGDSVLPWVVALLVVAVAEYWWYRWGVDRITDRRTRALIGWALVVLAVVAAVLVIIAVYRAGDSGARAVWG